MSNASYPRAERVRHAIHEILAAELERLNDPGLGHVTITDVNMSPDLRSARVYYTVYGSEVTKASTKDALDRAVGHMRSVVASQVHMRYTPKIEFTADPIPQRAARVENLIAQIRQTDPPMADDDDIAEQQ